MALGSGLGAVAEYASDDEGGGAGAGGLAGLASLTPGPGPGGQGALAVAQPPSPLCFVFWGWLSSPPPPVCFVFPVRGEVSPSGKTLNPVSFLISTRI